MALKRINKELTDLGRYVLTPSTRYDPEPSAQPGFCHTLLFLVRDTADSFLQ